MTEEATMSESELSKSLANLEALIKGQITTGPHSGQGAMKEEKENDDPDTAPNGTDYKPTKPSGGTTTAKGMDNLKSIYDSMTSKGVDDKKDDGDDDDDAEKGFEYYKGLGADDEEEEDEEEMDFDDKLKSAKKALGDDDEGEEEDIEEEEAFEDEEKGLPSPAEASLEQKSGKYTPPGKKKGAVKKSSDGLEVSDFLYHLTHALSKSLVGMELRLRNAIEKSHGSRGDLAKSMAQTMVDLKDQIDTRSAQVESIEKSAARAPKSTMRATDSGKGPSMQDVVADKKEVLSRMSKAVEEGSIDPFTVLRYESSGEVSADVLKSLGF